MILNQIREKIKDLISKAEEPPVYLAILIVLIAFASFGLGRLSLIDEKRVPVKITTPREANIVTQSAGVSSDTAQASVIASKNGTKYYFSWCSGLSRISAAISSTVLRDRVRPALA